MALLILVESPLTPVVTRLLQRPLGVVTLACVGLVAVTAVMVTVLSVLEWRARRTRPDHSRGPEAG